MLSKTFKIGLYKNRLQSFLDHSEEKIEEDEEEEQNEDIPPKVEVWPSSSHGTLNKVPWACVRMYRYLCN